MKGVFIFFISFFAGLNSLNAQAYQYVPLIDSSTNKEWRTNCVYGIHGGTNSLWTNVFIEGDTLINGTTAKKVWYYLNEYRGAVFEDGLKKVYYRDAEDTAMSFGKLIYDFSLNINDSVTLWHGPSSTGKCVLRQVDTILINGTLRKRFSLSTPGQITFIDSWIEGIGSVTYGLVAYWTCGLSFGTGYLCSAYSDNVLVYSVNNSFCPPNSATEMSEDRIDVSVYPNPSHDIILISLGNYFSKYRISILSQLGKILFESVSNTSHSEVDMRKFSSGLYFLQIVDEKGNRNVIRILKEE